MKKLPVLFLILMFAITGALMGCSDSQAPVTGDVPDNLLTRAESPNFNDAFGGYNMKDESPAFGDPFIAADLDDDASQDYNDPFATAADVVDMERTQRDQLFLMITWGNLHRDSTIESWTTWDGSLSTSHGAIVLKKTIRWDNHDRILPRTQRDLLEWESRTKPHFDGILVKVVVPTPAVSAAADTTVDSSQVVITFDTPPLNVSFTLDQLPGLNRVVTLDDGNAVAFMAVTRPPNSCPHGFARGQWMNHPERPGGFFMGRWATADGEVKGFMRGIYGTNDAGERVFFGKMITPDGRFEGIMRGRWGGHPGRDDGGWFAGHWVDRNLNIAGGIKGEWGRSDRCHGGFYRAVWAVNCDSRLDDNS